MEIPSRPGLTKVIPRGVAHTYNSGRKNNSVKVEDIFAPESKGLFQVITLSNGNNIKTDNKKFAEGVSAAKLADLKKTIVRYEDLLAPKF